MRHRSLVPSFESADMTVQGTVAKTAERNGALGMLNRKVTRVVLSVAAAAAVLTLAPREAFAQG
jgi:hypothetical protein